ncbi:MAG: ABC transporter permease [Gammaproteobacteria bacterium]|nr:ABC transporter permease [Gammaproteobacteria bacterium]
MHFLDYWSFSLSVFLRHRTRSLLIILAVAVGVAAVIVLTSFGEGARRFVEHEFSSLGSNLLIILPGKKETQGGAPPIYGTTPRELTIEDVEALEHISSIQYIAPIIAGTSLISYRNKSREVITLGATPDIFPIRQLTLQSGRIFPPAAKTQHVPVMIIGSKIKQELFGSHNPIGEWVKAGDFRFRISGVLTERGESMGLDLRDMAIIPVRSAEMLFDTSGLFRVLIETNQNQNQVYLEQRIRKIIAERHEGEDDISFISQDSILTAFNSILIMVTIVVGAIAAISLVVAGVLIMNVLFISVAQRKQEIGLLKALGATRVEVRNIFLAEAITMSSLGSLAGIVIGYTAQQLFIYYWPQFPIATPWWALLSAIATALTMGVLFSWLPASKAAKLDPIIALRGKGI